MTRIRFVGLALTRLSAPDRAPRQDARIIGVRLACVNEVTGTESAIDELVAKEIDAYVFDICLVGNTMPITPAASGTPPSAEKPKIAPITIKRYAQRRLYNTATSSYVTLENLAQMVKDGGEFAVYDAATGEDLTRSVLTKIIVEEGSGGRDRMREQRHVRLFRNGRNQAVRIPVEFELPGDEAIMHRDGDRLVIEPVRKRGLVALLKTMKPLGEDFPEISDPVPTPEDVL
jgi:antitoxin VapB